MSLLPNIDPNPANYVCAGVLYTTSANIGVLLRLEPNLQSQVINCFESIWTGDFGFESRVAAKIALVL